MKNDEKLKEFLERHGWEIECWSPLEIRHENGSFATMDAAEIVIFCLEGIPIDLVDLGD